MVELKSSVYRTRSRLRAIVHRVGDRLVGNVYWLVFGGGESKVYKKPTWWHLDGTHAFSRCDDLTVTEQEYEDRHGVPNMWR